MHPPLIDGFGRVFRYLRLSITDACNYRCVYCLPNGSDCAAGDTSAHLTVGEIGRLVDTFAALGISKVRLTGGEPTVRRDLVEIVARVASAIPRVALSTNGDRLATQARALVAAGLTQVNVSVDSLDDATFTHITGRRDRLARVRDGIEAALAAGLRVKVNVVLLRDLNSAELDDYVEWVRHTRIVVRFIELMRTGDNQLFYLRHHAPLRALRQRLLDAGWSANPRRADDGPAEELAHAAYAGGLGLIAPLDPRFCEQCNRLRVTSTGDLRLCLFGERDHPLRPYLANDASAEALAATIRALLARKPDAHRLREDHPGSIRHLAQVGG